MKKGISINTQLWFLIAALAGLLAISVACSSAAPTATPAKSHAAPTAAPVATATPAPTARPTATTAPTSTAAQIKRGGILRYPRTISIDPPDPAYSILQATRAVLPAIFDTIVRPRPDGTLAPGLAESWTFSSDGKTITFNLRKGVKFHDGTDFNAQAAKWNYDRLLDPAVGSPRRQELSPPLQKVEIVDDSTIRFTLSQPFRPLLAALSIQAGMMASPTAVQKYNSYSDRNGEFGKKPVGAGPFKLDEWIPGTRFRFSRNENFSDKNLPYLDGMDMPIIADSQIQFAMLRTGEIDVMEALDAQNIPLAERNPSLKVVAREGLNTAVIGFRLTVKPWDNKALRQAFAWAVNRKAEGDVAFGGRATPAQSMVGPGFGQWFDSTVNVYDLNIQKAKEKLVEAGYPNGFSFRGPCRVTTVDAQTCEVVQASLAAAGITMNIDPYDTLTYYSDFVGRKHSGPLISWFSSRPDAGILLRLLYHSNGSQNSWDFKNAQVDQLIEQADGVYDVAQAKALYRQVYMIVADELPMLPIAWWNNYYGIRTNVGNFQTYLDGVARFTETWLDK